MPVNIKFHKIKLIIELLNYCGAVKQKLLDELIIYATDETLLKRRVRMLSQLSQYEAQLLEKIHAFDTDNVKELNDAWGMIKNEISDVSHRSA
jgi:hypothetical protein